MYKKLFRLIILVLLLGPASNAPADIYVWDDSGADNLFDNPDNWFVYEPDDVDSYYIDRMFASTWPLIDSTVNSHPSGGVVVGYYALGPAELTMTGGSLSCDLGLRLGDTGGSLGILNMTGGTINVPALEVGYDGDGIVNLDGGIINVGSDNIFSVAINPSGSSSIDITEGTLLKDGDWTFEFGQHVSADRITAYSGDRDVVVTYRAGKTIVAAPGNPALAIAYNPDPADGAEYVASDANLSWSPGDYAASHNVYLGDDFNDVNSAAEPNISPGRGNYTEPNYSPTISLELSKTYYWRIDEVNDTNMWRGNVWSFTVSPATAHNPCPADGAEDVATPLNLEWSPGDYSSDVNEHDVYFSNDFNEVNDANIFSIAYKGRQDANSYGPVEIVRGQSYYWRIDEVNSEGAITKGNVWSFDFPSGTVNMRKGPYLLYPGENSKMTVLWQLESYRVCSLEWGLDTSYSSGSAAVYEYGTDHQFKHTITDLTPGSKYYYRVTVGSAQYTGSFLSAPAATASKVKFLAYGDSRSYPADHNTVNSAMLAAFQADPNYQSFTLHSGDWVSNGELENDWDVQFFDPSWQGTRQMQANLPINGCKGNHEGSGALFKKYWPYPYVSSFYLSFDYGPAHFAVVDQYTSYSTGSAQHTWLTNDLAWTDKEWKFIILHEPGYSAGSHSDNTGVRNYIQPLCEMYGVDIVFAGHNHYYARCNKNGVKHITTGGGGAPLYAPNPNYSAYVETCTQAHHFCKIEIDGRRLDFTAVKPDGTVIDAFSLIPSDINRNGSVDWYDLRILASQWLQPPGVPSADIFPSPNGDGIVDLLDFAELARAWFEELGP